MPDPSSPDEEIAEFVRAKAVNLVRGTVGAVRGRVQG